MSKRSSFFIERRKSRQYGAEWLTIYSDLMTNLMLFFLMLFALTRLSAADQKKVYESVKKDFTTIEEKQKFKKLIVIEKKTEDKIKELADSIDSMAKVSITESFIKMRLPSPVLFDIGRAELKEEGKKVLVQILQVLKTIPHQVVIEGHTDNVPISHNLKYFSNWELSGARAVAATKYLIDEGLSAERLSAIAYGEYFPLVPNDSKENRTKNRRIEINIAREK